MTDSQRHRNFPPVFRSDARLLVLGSLPGAVSLQQGRYYAHSRNQFWRLLSAVLDCDLVVLDYQNRLTTLKERHIALWDTVAEAERPGSLDVNIRLHAAADLAGLLQMLPDLRAVAFNGGTAARIGRPQISPTTSLTLIDLPSSSPAYTRSFDAKRQEWLILRDYL